MRLNRRRNFHQNYQANNGKTRKIAFRNRMQVMIKSLLMFEMHSHGNENGNISNQLCIITFYFEKYQTDAIMN